jgi:hypothetical protein
MRVGWVAIALLVLGAPFGLAHVEARRVLDRVEAQYRTVDQQYRALDWGVRYTVSSWTEADLEEFDRTGIRKRLSLEDLRWLRLLRNITFFGELRQEIDRTLGTLDFYLAKAKIEPARDQTDGYRLELMAALEKRFNTFSYDDHHGCKLTYRELSSQLNSLSPHTPFKGSVRCLVTASQALLTELQKPGLGADNLFRASLAVTHTNLSERIWTDVEYNELVSTWRALHGRLDSTAGRKIQVDFEGAFVEAASDEKARALTLSFYQALEFDLRGVSFEAHAKHGINFGGLTGLLAPQDIRVMVGPEYVQNPSYLTMMIHEMGHAVAHTSIRERRYAYWADAEGEVGEAFADLMLAMFEEAESLKRTGFAPFVKLASETDPWILRLRTPAALQFDLNVPEQRYQILQIQGHDSPPLDNARRFLDEWPEHKFNFVQAPGISKEERALILFIWELEPLVSYPLYCRSYVDAAMIIANVMNLTISNQKSATWEELRGLARKLRTVLAPGGKIKDPEILVGGLGVDMRDREAFFRGFKTYLGLSL